MKNFFNNTELAFEQKSDSELRRAKFLFSLISKPSTVKFLTKLTNFSIKNHLPVTSIIKKTVFDHFCGGVTEGDCLKVIDKMAIKNLSVVLDYSVEGKESDSQFDFCLNMTLKTIEMAKNHPKGIDFAVFKPTGFGRIDLFEKKSKKFPFTETESKEWERVVDRFEKAGQFAHEKGVRLLIDAEHSWMQDAADDLALQMMRKYNKERAIIYNTSQMYRWDRLQYIKDIYEISKTEGFYIGLKIVRGAYMEEERERASANGYKSPICIDKLATDENFNAAVKFMIENIDTMALYSGSHNEESVLKILNLMEEHNISHNDKRVYLGQLYGMSDHISYNLAKMEYNVSKYLPFGPVKEVIPYLIRRAEENTSVEGQTNKELEMLNTEIKRRKSLK